MPQIDPSQALTIFVGNMPTFIAVLLAWLNSNARTSDMRDALKTQINRRFDTLNQKIDHTPELLRAEFRRVEEVLDARLKHLEERE